MNTNGPPSVGIERIGLYAGRAFLDVKKLAQARGLDLARFDNALLSYQPHLFALELGASDMHSYKVISYGSGCSSEFFSGWTGPSSRNYLSRASLEKQLHTRHELSMTEYENILQQSHVHTFGTKDSKTSTNSVQDYYKQLFEGQQLAVLERIKNYHREYRWT